MMAFTSLKSVVCSLAITAICFNGVVSVGRNDKGSCPAQPEVMCGAPEQVHAGTTRSIRLKPFRFHQNMEKVCSDEATTRDYRTFDGSCNHAFNLGTAETPLRRMLPAEYDDKLNVPRSLGVDGYRLPTPTDVSRILHPDSDDFDVFSTFYMQWGQWIDHDIALSPLPTETNDALRCCGPDGRLPEKRESPECMPIILSPDDTRFMGPCMEFVRSIPALSPSGGKLMPREQTNTLTAFIDGSMIYGSSDELQRELRTHTQFGRPGALMRMHGHLLPKSEEENCMHRPGNFCFLAGDTRVNEQPGLTVMHTLWVRLHNAVATRLQPHRPRDTEEQVFQLTRKIVVGVLQNIHYREWLPLVLGPDKMRQYKLYPWARTGYSSAVDPRITNAFAGAAFRFGHSMIPRQFNVSGRIHLLRTVFNRTDVVNDDFGGVKGAMLDMMTTADILNRRDFFQRFIMEIDLCHWIHPLRTVFNRPDVVHDDFEGVMRAMLDSDGRSQQVDENVVSELTDHLFEPEDQQKRSRSRGLDLVALNIQRGRDHGLPPLNKYRKYCGLPPVTRFSEFGAAKGKALQSLYRSPDDIDLFTGGLLEARVPEGSVGPTFACILAEQFHALKYGDRFFYETNRQPEGFSDDQLNAIRKVTMMHVLCQSPGLTHVQRTAFMTTSASNVRISCARVRDNFLDLSLWADQRRGASLAPTYTNPVIHRGSGFF